MSNEVLMFGVSFFSAFGGGVLSSMRANHRFKEEREVSSIVIRSLQEQLAEKSAELENVKSILNFRALGKMDS